MTAIKRILLATDLEPRSDRAMERAVRLACQFGADLTALYAIRSGVERGMLDSLPPHHIEAEIRRHLESVAGAKDLSAMVVAAKGPVDAAMSRYAELWKADLMVAGRIERVDAPLAVTTVERISIASRVPLLAVAAKPFGPYASALVAVDFSRLSRAAVQHALAMTQTGMVELMHVHDVPLACSRDGLSLPPGDFAADFAKVLEGLETGGRLVSSVVRMGAPVAAILDAANGGVADLVVMGSAGRSGLGRTLMGSVAHEVLERSPCDVLIVRDPPNPAVIGGP
jgi:nucleotide-binding universal stress UspA family protein